MRSLTTSTARDWSFLPDEIWSQIASRLAGDRFDVTRFRSICKSFRSMIPRFDPCNSSSLPRFSFKIYPSQSSESYVFHSAVYKIRRKNRGTAWIIKVEFISDRIRLFDPLSSRQISEIPELTRFRLSEFRISELARAYTLRDHRDPYRTVGVEKILVSPNPAVVFVIFNGGRLGFAANGYKRITCIESRVVDFNDIALFRGQPYVVDRWGTVSWIDAPMRLVQYSPPLFIDGDRKHLVVSSGELYVVVRYWEKRSNDFIKPKSSDFQVFKLDEEWGRWEEVTSLGKTSFVLTCDCCFSIATHEFDEFEPNCIYFTDHSDADFSWRQLGRHGGCIFNMEFGTIKDLDITPGYSNITSTYDKLIEQIELMCINCSMT